MSSDPDCDLIFSFVVVYFDLVVYIYHIYIYTYELSDTYIVYYTIDILRLYMYRLYGCYPTQLHADELCFEHRSKS